jgi:hypothetical protein
MLCKSGSSSYTKHKKIWFAIFGFLCEFIWNLQLTESIHKTGKNLLALNPLGLLNCHRKVLGFSDGVLNRMKSLRVYPPAAGRARRRR